MNKQLIIIATSSGSRTSIRSDFRILTKDGFVEYLKQGKGAGQFRCGYANENRDTYLLKFMPLSTFEREFGIDHQISPIHIEKYFSADVKKKYGAISVKYADLEVGRLYTTTENTFIFLGNIEYKYESSGYNGKIELVTNSSNYGFIGLNSTNGEMRYISHLSEYDKKKVLRVFNIEDTDFQIPESKQWQLKSHTTFNVNFL